MPSSLWCQPSRQPRAPTANTYVPAGASKANAPVASLVPAAKVSPSRECAVTRNPSTGLPDWSRTVPWNSAGGGPGGGGRLRMTNRLVIPNDLGDIVTVDGVTSCFRRIEGESDAIMPAQVLAVP